MLKIKIYDEHTLYVTSGVAREDQIYKSIYRGIRQTEDDFHHNSLLDYIHENNLNEVLQKLDKNLTIPEKNRKLLELLDDKKDIPQKKKIKTDVKVNLIVNRNGEYYGFGYIYISNPEVYWMLLGHNPNGSRRVSEYPDPNWIPPLPMSEEEKSRLFKMSWADMADEEDRYIHPIIREVLNPLMTIPGYEYDKTQYKHLQQMAVSEGKSPEKVPKVGYFELSRAYSYDVSNDKIPNVLCSRKVPKWIAASTLKKIFSRYIVDTKEYPIIKVVEGKDNNIVFITFSEEEKDALFVLLMTRKVTITDPKRGDSTIIFDHAFRQNNRNNRNDRRGKRRSPQKR